jgi:hypothetical protein
MIRKDKIKQIDFLLNKFRETNHDFKELPKCSFLLGAGCSRSSEIPTGYEIIELLRKHWYLKNFANSSEFLESTYDIDNDAFQEVQTDFQSKYLEEETTLKEKVEIVLEDLRKNTPPYLSKLIKSSDEKILKQYVFDDLLYGFWFERFSESPKERQKLIEHLIDLKEPSGAYLLFSHLISNGKITNVFTTNFDDLIYDSLIRYTETKPKIYSHNEVAQYINTLSKRPNIIKLHGDFLFENIKNTKPETGLLWSNMENKLEECLKSFDLIVVGYNGADDSVMNALAKLKTKDYGLLWCGRNPENLNWRVKELINQTNNSYFIQIESFELLSMKLFEVYKDEIDYPDFRSNAERKEKEFHQYITEFKTELTENVKLEEKEIESINSTLDIVLDRNSFFRVAGLDHSEQLEFLRKLRIDGISRTLKNIHTNINWEQSKTLFADLDKGDFFQNKLYEVSIQHISNALSNLRKIDADRTKSILDSLNDEKLLEKINSAASSDLYSGISELKSISPNKIESILTKRKISPELLVIENQDLRKIAFKLKTLSPKDGLELLISNNEVLQTKIKEEPIKEVVLFLENVSSIYFKECQALFEKLENSFLADRILEQNLTLLSISLRVFNHLNRNKTKQLIKLLDKDELQSKLTTTSLQAIKSLLFALKEVDFQLSKHLLSLITDEQFQEKIEKADLLSIAESLEYLSKIDNPRISKIAKEINNELITYKIDNEDFTFQQFGNAMSKLIVFDFDKFCLAAREIDVSILTDKISKTINKTGEQVFLHFVPIYFKVNRVLFSNIIKESPQDYIDSILKLPKIDLYTVNLPYLNRVFIENKMDKEKEYVDYIISKNQARFRKKKTRNKKKH